MDEENLSEDEILRERSLSARVLSFNLQSNELYAVRIRNSTRKSPESRLNQVFVQLNDVANLLSAAASEEQQVDFFISILNQIREFPRKG